MNNPKKWITIAALAVPIVVVIGILVVGYVYTIGISIKHAGYQPLTGNFPSEKLLYLYNLLTLQTRNEIFLLKKIIFVSLVVYMLNLISLFYYIYSLRKRSPSVSGN